MKTASIDKITVGQLEENLQIHIFKKWNQCQIDYSEKGIEVYKDHSCIFKSILRMIEKDFLSITYIGDMPNGDRFRLVTAGGIVASILQNEGQIESLTVASLKPEGFAIHFDLIENEKLQPGDYYTIETKEENKVKLQEIRNNVLQTLSGIESDQMLGLLKSQRAREAKAYADELIAAKPEPSIIHYYRAIACSFLGDYLKAITNYDAVLEYLPDFLTAEAYLNRARAKLNMGNFLGALFDCNQSLKKERDYACAYANRGIINWNLGNKEQAREDINTALRIDPDNVDANHYRKIVN